MASGLIAELARGGKRLRRLDLSCNGIGDGGAGAVLRAVRACPRDHLLAVRLLQVRTPCLARRGPGCCGKLYTFPPTIGGCPGASLTLVGQGNSFSPRVEAQIMETAGIDQDAAAGGDGARPAAESMDLSDGGGGQQRPTGGEARPAPIELGSSSDSDGRASAGGRGRRRAQGPSRSGRSDSPRQGGAARRQGARGSPSASARGVGRGAQDRMEVDTPPRDPPGRRGGLDSGSEDEEPEEGESESEILARVFPREIVREYERLKGSRLMYRADFRDIGAKVPGLYRLIFRRFLACGLSRRINLKVRRRPPARLSAPRAAPHSPRLRHRGRRWGPAGAGSWRRSCSGGCRPAMRASCG